MAPITKNGAFNITAGGATPITKNADAARCVKVVDESGNPLEPTYPRRARGLVKSGRARYAPGDESAIILTVTEKTGPPVENIDLPEDIKVDNTINYTAAEQQNAGVRFDVTDSQYNSKMLSYVMSKIDELAKYPQYIDNAIISINSMPVNECPNGGTGDAAKANAISTSIAAREETNRALIAFLKQVYEDVRPQPKTSKENSAFTAVMQSISELISSIDPDTDNASDVLGFATTFLQTAADACDRIN